MPQDRYYIDAPLQEGSLCSLTEKEHHHLVHVARARLHTPVELVNGRGQLAQGQVEALHKKAADIRISHVFTQDRPKPELILSLAMPRKNHLEWVIEKATELDATQIWLFPGMKSEITQLTPALLQRLTHLLIAALKQSGRLDLPQILLKPPLLEWPHPLKGTLLFGDTSPQAPYLWTLPSPLSPPITLFIGPESGFSSQEHAFLIHTLKAQGVRLHPNILRAETAPIVGLSLIQAIIKNHN